MNRAVHKNEDLHGNAPDSCPVALLLVDVLNDLHFPGNSRLLNSAASLGKNIALLKKRCAKAGIRSIYVNDNRGKWRSDFSVVLTHCLRAESPGLPMVSPRLFPKSPMTLSGSRNIRLFTLLHSIPCFHT